MNDPYSAIEKSLRKLNINCNINIEQVLQQFKDDQINDETMWEDKEYYCLGKYIQKPGQKIKFKILFEQEYEIKREAKINNASCLSDTSDLMSNLLLNEQKRDNEFQQRNSPFPSYSRSDTMDLSQMDTMGNFSPRGNGDERERNELRVDSALLNEWFNFYTTEFEDQIRKFKAKTNVNYLLTEQMDESQHYAMKALAPEEKFAEDEIKSSFLARIKEYRLVKLSQNAEKESEAKSKAQKLKLPHIERFRQMLVKIEHEKFKNVNSLSSHLQTELAESISSFEKQIVQLLQTPHAEEIIKMLKKSLNEISQECINTWIENKEFDLNISEILIKANATYKMKMDQKFEIVKFYANEDFQKCHDESCNSVFIILKYDLDEIKSESKKEKGRGKILNLLLELKDFYVDQNNANKPNPNAWIGIDLGTTYSSVSIYTKDEFVNIPIDGKPSIPSVVAYSDKINKNFSTVGTIAAEEAFKYPKLTFSDAKRLMGRKLEDETVQIDKKYWTFDVGTENGKKDELVKFVADYGNEKVFISPEEISARILLKMFIPAIKYLQNEKRTLAGAVIGIPAGSSSQFKEATENAVKLATDNLKFMGLIEKFDYKKNVKFISEPVAVAYAYRPYLEMGQKIFILDIGGGTLDITILQIARQVQVKCTSGNTHLGGQDIDNYLYTFVRNKYKELHGIDIEELKPGEFSIDGRMRMSRLKWEIEKRKRDLSGEECPKAIKLEMLKFFQNSTDFSFLLTRKDLEKALEPFYQDMKSEILKAIVHSNIKMEDISKVVLVGGTTNLPKIREVVKELFGDKKLHDKVNKELAVSYGAAFEAARANGELNSSAESAEILEVLPISFGVETNSSRFGKRELIFDKILHKGKQFPFKATNKYFTLYPGQKTVRWVVREGENEKEPEKNEKIGEFNLNNIPPNGNDVQQLTCEMSIDEKLKLVVTATCVCNGEQKQINIQVNRGGISQDSYKNSERRIRLGAINDFD